MIQEKKTTDPLLNTYFEKLKKRRVVLKASGLGKEFMGNKGPTVALKNVDFEVHHREFFTIIGPSGCGKSTLIRIVAGLEEKSSGSLLLDGEEIEGPGPDRGMVFQSYTLFPWLTVLENVMFGPLARGREEVFAEAEAKQWVEMVGLNAFSHAYPRQLSGGMKQRVAIARALANQPKILLMDEPFGALDAQTRSRMQGHLLEIWNKVDLTVLFITHDLDEAVYLSDRILVLKANPGEVMELIEVPVPHPRSDRQFGSPEFLACKHKLEELIHGGAGPSPEPEMEFPMKLIQLAPIDGQEALGKNGVE